MHIIFSDATGRREGVVLAADATCMRVAVRGADDIVEVPLSKNEYPNVDGRMLEIDSLTFSGPFQGLESLVRDRERGHGCKAVA